MLSLAKMAEPIPVISDLAKVVGDNDGVSLLDIATILQNTGVIPADYQALVTLAKTVIKITNIINKIETQQKDLDKLYIDVGDFDLIGNQGNPNDANYQDIRDVAPAKDPTPGKGTQVTDLNWSDLHSIAEAIDLGALKKELAKDLGDFGTELGDALDELKQQASGGPNHAGIKLSFPITDKPYEAIFGMLIGKDTDLVSFEADAHLDVKGEYPIFSYQGFEVSLTGGLFLDAHLKMAYDTYGLRNIVLDFFNDPDSVSDESVALNLLDGLYLDPTTHLDLGVSLGIKGGVNFELLQAYVEGHLDAG